jgi:hypothetical protein
VLIGNRDGNILKEWYRTASAEDKAKVNIQIAFIPGHKTKKVEVEYWYTSSEDRAMRFLQELGDLLKPIMYHVDFYVRTVNWACPNCDADYKHKNCYSNGAYCAMQKHGSTVEGKEILAEDLR